MPFQFFWSNQSALKIQRQYSFCYQPPWLPSEGSPRFQSNVVFLLLSCQRTNLELIWLYVPVGVTSWYHTGLCQVTVILDKMQYWINWELGKCGIIKMAAESLRGGVYALPLESEL